MPQLTTGAESNATDTADGMCYHDDDCGHVGGVCGAR